MLYLSIFKVNKTLRQVVVKVKKGARSMAKVKMESQKEPKAKLRPALTPQARENQLISLAMDLAEERLRNGSATSQEVTHFLKLGSSKERLEREKLEEENKLLKAKTENLQSQKKTEELFEDAIRAMRSYSGHMTNNIEDEDDEYY